MLHFLRKLLWLPFPALQAGLAALCLLATVDGSAHGESLLWYGGDVPPSSGFINNTRVSADFGSSVLDDFVVSDGWHVTGLFSNNVADYPINTAPFTQAVWSIRTGVGPGDPGNILFGGLSSVTVTPTGRTFGGDVEYTVAVSGLSLDLAPGVYFMNVSPVAMPQIYYVGISDGTNAVGIAGPGGIFREDRFIVNGTLQDDVVGPSMGRASMGVIGTVVPEPATATLLGIALLGLFLLRYLRLAGGRIKSAESGTAVL
jgi:hypothetical protein